METGKRTIDEQTASLPVDACEILKGIKSGELPASAKSMDMKGVFLAGEDLSGMDLSGVDFTGADLTRVNLSGARLFKVNFTKALLLHANLDDSELTAAILDQADMEGMSARRAGFGMASLKGAKAFQANLIGATLTKADISKTDFRCATLEKARIREARIRDTDFTGGSFKDADLSLCDVTGSDFGNVDMRGARLRAIDGFNKAKWIGVDIRDINFAGAYCMRRFIVDQNYLKEFRDSSPANEVIYHFWLLTSDCGRSLGRWCLWILVQTIFFAWLYSMVGLDYGAHRTFLSPLYFSVVTLTTLGFGDVVPATVMAQVVTMLEVVIGYIMLGGLLSILSVKMSRRAE